MRAPADLDRAAKRLWRAVAAEIEERAPLGPAGWVALERYVRAVALARRCWDELPDDRLVTLGGNMQEMAHPLIRSALFAERAAASFAEDLGLSRKPARREGRPTAAASAPDRVTARPTALRKAA